MQSQEALTENSSNVHLDFAVVQQLRGRKKVEHYLIMSHQRLLRISVVEHSLHGVLSSINVKLIQTPSKSGTTARQQQLTGRQFTISDVKRVIMLLNKLFL